MLHGHIYHDKACPQCSKFSNKYRKTQKEFEEFVESIHPNTYDFSEAIYVDEQTFVKLRCKTHNVVIEVRPENIKGRTTCCGEKRKQNNTNTQKEKERQFNNFLQKANKIHNNIYDYSKVVYDVASIPVIIVCKEHGEFVQKPKYHLSGCGCQKCGIQKIVKKLTKDDFDKFVESANKKHDNKYEYFRETYKGASTKTKILCKKCNNFFFQSPYLHLDGNGCPNCKFSKGEKLIQNYLKECNFNFAPQYKNITCKRQNYLPFDFSLNFGNDVIGLIEYNGIQHYEVRYFSKDVERNTYNFETIKQNDTFKQTWAKDNDIPLLVVKYDTIDVKMLVLYFYILCLINYIKKGK